MSDINIREIRNLREESAKKVVEITDKIQSLEAQLVAFKERVKVYDELLNGVIPTLDEATESKVETPLSSKKRAPRSTKLEMDRRRKVIGKILFKQGDMQPKDLLSMVSEELDYTLESHHLRAVLRRFTDVFMPCVDRHGYWGLTGAGKKEFSDDTE